MTIRSIASSNFAWVKRSLIESSEYYNPLDAEISFDNILDRITGSDPSVTDYILEGSTRCPRGGIRSGL